jgi:hypothetical protein
MHEGEALHRRDADAQTGKRAGTRSHGKEIDVGHRNAALIEERQNLARQPLAGCSSPIALALIDDAVVLDERQASRSR